MKWPLIESLGEKTDDKEVLEQQNQAKKKLNGVYKELQFSRTPRKKCWVDVFTIAFWWRTNAGKSTLIETLRILLSEPTKIADEKSTLVAQAINHTRTDSENLEEGLSQINISFQIKAEQVNEKLKTQFLK